MAAAALSVEISVVREELAARVMILVKLLVLMGDPVIVTKYVVV